MPPSNSNSSSPYTDAAIAERFASSLLTQAEVNALCMEHGVPSVYTARPAGDMLASSAPPPGSVCVHAHALEAGMRVPLHAFFCEALAHFGLAPAQLAPDGWRVLVGFVVLCDFAGVAPPSLAVFRSFFSPREAVEHGGGWYGFCSRDGSLQARMPHRIKDWKSRFFFLSSPEPWPCPVEWGEPAEDSVMEPVLTDEEKKWAAKLLRSHGGAAVGLKTYLCSVNQAAGALIATASPPPPQPRFVKTEQEPCRSSPLLSGRKRSFEEATGEDSAARSVLKTPPPSTPGCSVLGFGGACSSPPPGFSAQNRDGNPQSLPDRHDGDSAGWEAARKVLECAVTPSRERAFAAAKPSDVIAWSYVAMLQAANYASFSLGYAFELEGKLVERDAEIAALRKQLENATAELAATKVKLESAKATVASDDEHGSRDKLWREAMPRGSCPGPRETIRSI